MAEQTVTLWAESKCGSAKSQYVAKIIGRAPQWQFNRMFVGAKSGRNTGYETDELGLYETCDLSKRGVKDQSYWLVMPWQDGVVLLQSDKSDALKIAKRLDSGEPITDIVTVEYGEQIVKFEFRRECSECGQNLAAEERCTAHPDAVPISRAHEAPQVNADGTPKRCVVYWIRGPSKTKLDSGKSASAAIDVIVSAMLPLSPSERHEVWDAAMHRLANGS